MLWVSAAEHGCMQVKAAQGLVPEAVTCRLALTRRPASPGSNRRAWQTGQTGCLRPPWTPSPVCSAHACLVRCSAAVSCRHARQGSAGTCASKSAFMLAGSHV